MTTVRVVEVCESLPPMVGSVIPVKAPSEGLRVVSGPTRCTHSEAWEVEVALLVYSSKLAMRAYTALPDCIELDGCVYHKAGMKASDCIAWYRS